MSQGHAPLLHVDANNADISDIKKVSLLFLVLLEKILLRSGFLEPSYADPSPLKGFHKPVKDRRAH